MAPFPTSLALLSEIQKGQALELEVVAYIKELWEMLGSFHAPPKRLIGSVRATSSSAENVSDIGKQSTRILHHLGEEDDSHAGRIRFRCCAIVGYVVHFLQCSPGPNGIQPPVGFDEAARGSRKGASAKCRGLWFRSETRWDATLLYGCLRNGTHLPRAQASCGLFLCRQSCSFTAVGHIVWSDFSRSAPMMCWGNESARALGGTGSYLWREEAVMRQCSFSLTVLSEWTTIQRLTAVPHLVPKPSAQKAQD
ncbi:uncharacterized protein IWZ02DRAFT_149953 [Phyllosticta citriasiana]|uniref:Uncharacterized protein n=1 Tax=Phyllosticta citriasiana TaxID=595635 RepID=A0ABR1KVV0_9PEZI